MTKTAANQIREDNRGRFRLLKRRAGGWVVLRIRGMEFMPSAAAESADFIADDGNLHMPLPGEWIDHYAIPIRR